MRLTVDQIGLFAKLVINEMEGRLFLPIRPIPANADEYVIYLRGKPNLRFRDFGDIDALSAAGLLSYKMGRTGISKEFLITKVGRELFKSGTLTEELELERVNVLERRTSDLKIAFNFMMAGEPYERALTEMRFVLAQLAFTPPSRKRIQPSLQHINELIASRFGYVTFEEATATAAAFGAWCEAIQEMIDTQ